MALVIRHMQFLQRSDASYPAVPLSLNKRVKLRHHATVVQIVGKSQRCLSLKQDLRLGVGASCLRGRKLKCLRISAFKGNAQNEESGTRPSGSNVAKNGVKVSYLSNGNDETVSNSTREASDVPLPYASEATETIAGSSAIYKLFKKWLTILRTQTPSQAVDGILGGRASSDEVSDTQSGTQNKERGKILKAIWDQFWHLDATIKIPVLIFVPWYLAFNMIYGADVSKELTPLWVLGPLVVAFYVKMLRGLFALYVFTFKQTVKIVKNLPSYCSVAYNYVACGKLREDIRAHVLKPVEDTKNLDYKDVSRRKLKEFREWLVEKYLDFVELIWPYYCRTIRFLKQANLI